MGGACRWINGIWWLPHYRTAIRGRPSYLEGHGDTTQHSSSNAACHGEAMQGPIFEDAAVIVVHYQHGYPNKSPACSRRQGLPLPACGTGIWGRNARILDGARSGATQKS
ncbi:hypothetical protein LMH87_002258 [Akanthomyces muscarius]|uniref:Uncharacterized protein n=1 Tax=Akanthomyces muscarius TaxID=2231603 RepID=A0A9W8Q5X8_AKAMU|nr:hypothetical protein LMH87_002258 [Akanthomyces muscarius]KAJ4147752.1 hypothetical protein LMH87_002258 [Akanthomyces muscarius]